MRLFTIVACVLCAATFMLAPTADAAKKIDVFVYTETVQWIGQAQAQDEADTLIKLIEGKKGLGEVVNDPAKAVEAWTKDHTVDKGNHIIVMFGDFPKEIYPNGKGDIKKGSVAEEFLDAGNTFSNSADYFFWGQGGRNEKEGLQNMMDIPGIVQWDDDTPMKVTKEGKALTPSLDDYNTDRPFHLDDLDNDWEIAHAEDVFVRGEVSLEPSKQFLQELEFSQRHLNIFRSEGARCEAVIYPILREVYKAYAEDYVLWIKEPLAYDATLSGTPDYFVATRSEFGKPVIGTPLVILVEAKKNDFEVGWGQCLAALIAAQKIQAAAAFPVYGIVTDGVMWQFGKLVGDTFTENLTPFSLGDLPRLFGAIDAVFKAAHNGSIAREEQ